MPPESSLIKGSLESKVVDLMVGRVGKTRQKAILTIAKRKNITRLDARLFQAKKIASKNGR